MKLAVVLFYFRLEQNAKSTTNQNVELNFVHRELAFSLGPGFTESSVTINTRKRAAIGRSPYKQNPVSSEVHGKAGYKEFVKTRMHSSRMHTACPLPPSGQTDTCENITLPQTSFTGGKNINSPIILGGCAALLMNKKFHVKMT